LVSEQDEYLDWVEFAQIAFKRLSPLEINELIDEMPELSVLAKGEPFTRENVIGVIDP